MKTWLALWLVSLVVVAGAASVLTSAQAVQPGPTEPQGGRIVSGSDLGFRVEGIDRATGRPIGQLVIQVKGQWQEVGFAGGVRRLTSHP
jgi:hypothetical protein